VKTVKRFLAILLVLVLLFTLPSGCKRAEKSKEPDDKQQQEQDQQQAPPDPDNEEELPPDEEKIGEQPSTAEGLPDGTYEGQSDKDERGSYGIAILTIENGKIVDAQYSEINGQDNLPKSEENGYTYEDALKAFDILPERLKEVQDVDKVDVVSKATGTSNKFKTAAKNALYKASQQQGDSGDNDTDTDAEDRTNNNNQDNNEG
jgi:major membrane immunogen (membrane-anchored lipoprotein)